MASVALGRVPPCPNSTVQTQRVPARAIQVEPAMNERSIPSPDGAPGVPPIRRRVVRRRSELNAKRNSTVFVVLSVLLGTLGPIRPFAAARGRTDSPEHNSLPTFRQAPIVAWRRRRIASPGPRGDSAGQPRSGRRAVDSRRELKRSLPGLPFRLDPVVRAPRIRSGCAEARRHESNVRRVAAAQPRCGRRFVARRWR